MDTEAKRNYHRNYYINQRDYIRGLDAKDELTAEELMDLNKYIHKFRPKSTRFPRSIVTNPSKGAHCTQLQKEIKQVVITFD